MYIMGMDLTNVRTAAQGSEFRLGTIGMRSDGRQYKYVEYRNNAGIAAVIGNVVGYNAPAGSFAALGYALSRVTSDVSEALVAAGVLAAIIPDLGFGWIQIKGPATITPALVSGADGQPLVLSVTTDGTLRVAALATDTIGVAFAQSAAGRSIMCNFPY